MLRKINLMNNFHTITGGFSLVELMVVVVMIAVLSFAAVVGFGRLGEVLKVREVSSLIRDVVGQEELKILRGELNRSTVYLLEDYMIIDESGMNDRLSISIIDTVTDCDETGLLFDSDSDADLTQMDDEGNVIDSKRVLEDSELCVYFNTSEEVEWAYQLSNQNEVSNIIRFVHYNLNRDRVHVPVQVSFGAGHAVRLEAPYGKRLFLDDSGVQVENFSIEISNADTADKPEVLEFK